MKTNIQTVSIQTHDKQQLIDMTAQLRDAIRTTGIRDGFVGVFSQHTTAMLMVNEYQDALLEDVHGFLGDVVSDDRAYRHNCPEVSDCDRKNAASHLRSLLFNHSVLLPLSEGSPGLGQFQSVILAELDGPRQRQVKIQVIGE